jgi:hypothetical protein
MFDRVTLECTRVFFAAFFDLRSFPGAAGQNATAAYCSDWPVAEALTVAGDV